MKQDPVISSTGMFTRFNITRVIRTAELNYNQILRAFDTLRPGEIHNMESLVIVDKVQQNISGRLRQTTILKAVVVSEEYYEARKTAEPTVVPYITEINTADDFFLPDDRFSRSIAKLSPTQERLTNIFTVGAGGVVDVELPYVESSLRVTPALVPTDTDGDAGTVTFPLINVGDEVTLSYITQALHPTLLIKRQATQPSTTDLFITNNTHAVIMNPTLAGLLGITLPSY